MSEEKEEKALKGSSNDVPSWILLEIGVAAGLYWSFTNDWKTGAIIGIIGIILIWIPWINLAVCVALGMGWGLGLGFLAAYLFKSTVIGWTVGILLGGGIAFGHIETLQKKVKV